MERRDTRFRLYGGMDRKGGVGEFVETRGKGRGKVVMDEACTVESAETSETSVAGGTSRICGLRQKGWPARGEAEDDNLKNEPYLAKKMKPRTTEELQARLDY